MSQNQDHFDIDYIAQLARIQLLPEEKKKLVHQLNTVLHHFEKLQSVDTSNIEPMVHPFSHFNVWEDDVPSEPFAPEVALLNAPEKKENQVHVPVVVE